MAYVPFLLGVVLGLRLSVGVGSFLVSPSLVLALANRILNSFFVGLLLDVGFVCLVLLVRLQRLTSAYSIVCLFRHSSKLRLWTAFLISFLDNTEDDG